MKNFEIKISGSGTLGQITSALHELIKELDNLPYPEEPRNIYEDETICTEITEL